MSNTPAISLPALYDYVVWLGDTLEARGSSRLANRVKVAGRFASGSSTEFFGETGIALNQVKDEHGGLLSEQETFRLMSVIRNVERELHRVNSA